MIKNKIKFRGNFEKAVEDKYKELSGCGRSIGVECETLRNGEMMYIILVVYDTNSSLEGIRTFKMVKVDEFYRSGDELVCAIVFETMFS